MSLEMPVRRRKANHNSEIVLAEAYHEERWGEIAPTSPTTREEFAARIGVLWKDAQRTFVEIGRQLQRAKAQLPHGDFEGMVERDLPFGKNAAYKLRVVAEAIDTGRLPSDFAPQDYSTCYLIASLKDEELAVARERNLVRPDVTRADLLAFKRSLKSQSHSEEEIRATLVAERDRLVKRIIPRLQDNLKVAQNRLVEIERQLAGKEMSDLPGLEGTTEGVA
jgi:hypothetical protein